MPEVMRPVCERLQMASIFRHRRSTSGNSPVANFTVDYKKGSRPLQIQFLESAKSTDEMELGFPGGNPVNIDITEPSGNL
jgi:PKD repeat protein